MAHEHNDNASNIEPNSYVSQNLLPLENAMEAAGSGEQRLNAALVIHQAGPMMRRVDSHQNFYSFKGPSREAPRISEDYEPIRTVSGGESGTSRDCWSATVRCRFSDGEDDVELHNAPVKTCVRQIFYLQSFEFKFTS